MLLPHNSDIAKPRALNTFLDGLAELGDNKRLIKNKKILSELLEKEKQYSDNEDSKNNEEQSIDSENEEEAASENNHSQDTENSDPEVESDNQNSDSESNPIVQQKDLNSCQHCVKSQMFIILRS